MSRPNAIILFLCTILYGVLPILSFRLPASGNEVVKSIIYEMSCFVARHGPGAGERICNPMVFVSDMTMETVPFPPRCGGERQSRRFH